MVVCLDGLSLTSFTRPPRFLTLHISAKRNKRKACKKTFETNISRPLHEFVGMKFQNTNLSSC